MQDRIGVAWRSTIRGTARAFLVTMLLPLVCAAGPYSFTTIKPPLKEPVVPGAQVWTQSLYVNNSGVVAGWFWQEADPPGAESPTVFGAFYYSEGTYKSIKVPGATVVKVTGINNKGEVGGVYCLSKGYLYYTLNDHQTPWCNPSESEVGLFIYRTGPIRYVGGVLQPRLRTFPHPGGEIEGGPNDARAFVGSPYPTSNYYYGFVHTPDPVTYTTFSPAGTIELYRSFGINDAGAVVGFRAVNWDSPQGAFLWDTSTYTALDFPGVNDKAMGINNVGVIVGYTIDLSDNNINGINGYRRSVSGAFHDINVPAMDTTYPRGINDAGWIAGTYRDSSFEDDPNDSLWYPRMKGFLAKPFYVVESLADFDVIQLSSGQARLTMTLAADKNSVIKSFGFGSLGGRIERVAEFATSDPRFQLVGSPRSGFGAKSERGIHPGEKASFSFTLVGQDVGTLTRESFLDVFALLADSVVPARWAEEEDPRQ